MHHGGLRRSASFTAGPSDRPTRPSRIPTLVDPMMQSSLTTPTLLRRSGSVRLSARSPIDANHLMASPSVLRRTGSMRLPSKSPTIERTDKEVWGIGSGSWGKRQQQLRRQHSDKTLIKGSGTNTPLSCRGSTTSIDRLHLGQQYRRPFEDDEDLCSEMSYDSTMSVDRLSTRRYIVHCSSDQNAQQNGLKPYLTPTQRTTLLNKELKAKLKHALDDCSLRDMEISRLTQECVELRMKHARLSLSPDVSPVSPTPPGIEKDSLNSSMHSELPLESVSVSIVSEDDPRNKAVFEETRDKQSLIPLEEPIAPIEKLTSSSQIVFQDKENNLSAIVQLESNRQLYSQSEGMRFAAAPLIEESQSSQVVPSHRINISNEDLVQITSPLVTTKHSSSFEAHITQRSPSTREVPINNNLYTRDEETYSKKPTRPDILNLNFSEDGRGQQPDNCLFNSLPAVFQVPVWQEKCAQPDKTPDVSVIQPIDVAKRDECKTESIIFKEIETQTDPDEMEEQLKAAQEALIETKVSCSCTCSSVKGAGSRSLNRLDAVQALTLWRAAQTQVQLSRLRSAAESSQAEVTLKFLKSAFYHLVTDSSQGMALATKSHWRAIQSILGFSQDECEAMDSAVATGNFPGSTW